MSARVVIIGFDAAEPTILERLVAAGRMPTLGRLRSEGTTARLTNSMRTLPGAIWPELATGVSAGRAALYFHPRQLRTGEAVARPVTADEIDGSSQYGARAALAGERTLTIDVPQAVLVSVDGVQQICEWGLHDRTFSVSSHPAALVEAIQANVGDHPVQRCDTAHGGSIDGYRRMVDGLRRGAAAKAEFAADLVAGSTWDLATVVFAESHCVGHQCFHFHDPGHTQHDPAAPSDLRAALATVYTDLDAAAQRIIEAAGPDVTVLLVASHDMGRYVGGYQLLPPLLEALGYGGQKQPHLKPAKSALPLRRAVRRALPSALKERRDAARRADPSSLARRVFTDPTQRAAVVDNNRCGAIRLNVVGREPDGAVDPAEVAATLDALRAELLELRDPATGEPIVAQVQSADEAYGSDHHPDLPDLLVDFRTDLGPLEACTSPSVGTIERSFASRHLPRTGDHTPESRLWMAGPGLREAPRALDADVLDLAPTVLDLLGVIDAPSAEGLHGRSLLEHTASLS